MKLRFAIETHTHAATSNQSRGSISEVRFGIDVHNHIIVLLLAGDKICVINNAVSFFSFSFYSFQAVMVHNDIVDTDVQSRQKSEQCFWSFGDKKTSY